MRLDPKAAPRRRGATAFASSLVRETSEQSRVMRAGLDATDGDGRGGVGSDARAWPAPQPTRSNVGRMHPIVVQPASVATGPGLLDEGGTVAADLPVVTGGGVPSVAGRPICV